MTFSPDYPLARIVPSPNHGERLRPISMLILHYTGMPTASSALDLLRDPTAEVSAHYFVEEDGGVLQLVPEARRAWHAGKSFWGGETDVNSASIGVEIVHPGHDDPRPYPARQIAAVAALARDICERRGIAKERVLAHSDIAVRRKVDPVSFSPGTRWLSRALDIIWLRPQSSATRRSGSATPARRSPRCKPGLGPMATTSSRPGATTRRPQMR